MRTVGGTALSADGRCRLVVPPFAFDGGLAHVVTIVRQVPEAQYQIPDLSGVEDTRQEARDIYKKLPRDSQLLSAIYRIYPNGLNTEPPAFLEIDYDPKALNGLPIEAAKEGISLSQYNPITELWESLPTQWFAKTARAELGKVADYASYVALIKRTVPAKLTDVTWKPLSALTGFWAGETEPSAEVTVHQREHSSSGMADDQGKFSIPYTLQNKLAEYTITAIPSEGEKFAATTRLKIVPGAFTSVGRPTLMALPAKADGHDYLLLSCDDTSLRNYEIKSPRSILLRVVGANRSGETFCELSEEIPGSGIFTGKLHDSDLVTDLGKPLEEPLNLQAGATFLKTSLPDTSSPSTKLQSPTHPCLLFASVTDKEQLRSSKIHSLARIQKEDGGWSISGVDDEPSARMTFWPVKMFSTDQWSIVGFTYRLYEPTGWQLMLRQGSRIEGFHFGSHQGNPFQLSIPVYAKSEPLLANGKWHFWQGSLNSPKPKYISQIFFGSWKQTGYYRIDPGFTGKTSQPLSVREVFVGRSYPDTLVNMNWVISDRSPLKQITWWVDQDADSDQPTVPKGDGRSDFIKNPQTGNNGCHFELPGDGRWFFHIVVTDVHDNQSPRKTYPLFIYRTKQVEAQQTSVAAGTNHSQGQKQLLWEQPDGKLEIPLPGFGTSIDPKTLIIEVLDQEFPITSPIWDAGREILVLEAESFKQGAPLGFDGETLTLQILAKNPAGEPIPDLPFFQVSFSSPLKWNSSPTGGKIEIMDPNSADLWIAGWRNPDAPWREKFPGVVNNTLLFTQTYHDKLSRAITRRWLRPLKVQSVELPPIFEKETLLNPTVEEISEEEAKRLPILDISDTKSHIPIKDSNSHWAYKTNALTPFDPGYIRVISRTASSLSIKRLKISDLKRALDFQQKNETLRIDAWLPPGDGNLEVRAPGNRRILIGHAWDSVWERATDNTLSFTSDQEWKRVSIVLIPKSDFENPKKSRVKGNVYW